MSSGRATAGGWLWVLLEDMAHAMMVVNKNQDGLEMVLLLGRTFRTTPCTFQEGVLKYLPMSCV